MEMVELDEMEYMDLSGGRKNKYAHRECRDSGFSRKWNGQKYEWYRWCGCVKGMKMEAAYNRQRADRVAKEAK